MSHIACCDSPAIGSYLWPQVQRYATLLPSLHTVERFMEYCDGHGGRKPVFAMTHSERQEIIATTGVAELQAHLIRTRAHRRRASLLVHHDVVADDGYALPGR
jgi:hypothetical protein